MEYARMQVRTAGDGWPEAVIYAPEGTLRSRMPGDASWGELAREAMAFARTHRWRPEETSLYWYVASDNGEMTRNLERDRDES
ncbi:hypothetical protein [Streptomyces cacaoi]|uniref:hypothetical protein n=1 Tax=Streptomyces cacaoi TaxID=1898 RepID=UPI0011425E26|nr:hypothetical protein [Streptomyces cacaoi]